MPELQKSMFSRLLVAAYRWRPLRSLSLRMALSLEGGQFYSATVRIILERYYKVRVGAYSYGEGLLPGVFPPGVTVGRYVSMAPGVRVFLRNHPVERLSLHPFFYNSQLGFVAQDTITSGVLEIGHDAWIGERVIITPGCSRIGLGAVIGAGAIVTKDVPDFGVVAGNPAKFLRFRFPPDMQDIIRNSKWWERSVKDCARHIACLTTPLDCRQLFVNPLLADAARSRSIEQNAVRTETSHFGGI